MVKALKVLLAPKGQAARVFESEYGRKPALKPSIDAKTGQADLHGLPGHGRRLPRTRMRPCRLQRARNGPPPGGGRALPGPGNIAQSSHRVNRTDGCTLCNRDQSFRRPVGIRINPQWLGTVRNDPYIKALMREYRVDTAEGLETQLTQALAERRAGAGTVAR